MSKNLFIDKIPKKTKVALVENGVMVEFYVEYEDNLSIVGNIYVGEVKNILLGMNAAFVDLGMEKNAFLYMGETLVEKEDIDYSTINQNINLNIGDKILVQVVKDQFGTKGARITTNITIAGRYLAFMPTVNYIGVSKKIIKETERQRLYGIAQKLAPQNQGFVVRTATENVSEQDIERDAARLILLYENIKKKCEKTKGVGLIYSENTLEMRTIRDIFSMDVDKVVLGNQEIYDFAKNEFHYYGYDTSKLILYHGEREMFFHFELYKQVAKLLERKVELENGGFLVIDKTEALTVIDVNTGKFVGENNFEETVFATNIEACFEIAKQIRLRNIGGIIICDFIDMDNEFFRNQILETLNQCVLKDRIRTKVVGMTGLSLVEITRKKTINDSDSFLLENCERCSGTGKMPSRQYIGSLIRAKLIEVFLDDCAVGALITTNLEISNFLYENNVFLKDLKTIFARKRIYVAVDEKLHHKNFKVSVSRENIMTLPNNARLLF